MRCGNYRWSFGVVAWEILTYGKCRLLSFLYCSSHLAEMPYGNENFARSIKGMVQHLKSGGRLSCPTVTDGPTLYEISVTIVI